MEKTHFAPTIEASFASQLALIIHSFGRFFFFFGSIVFFWFWKKKNPKQSRRIEASSFHSFRTGAKKRNKMAEKKERRRLSKN